MIPPASAISILSIALPLLLLLSSPTSRCADAFVVPLRRRPPPATATAPGVVASASSLAVRRSAVAAAVAPSSSSPAMVGGGVLASSRRRRPMGDGRPSFAAAAAVVGTALSASADDEAIEVEVEVVSDEDPNDDEKKKTTKKKTSILGRVKSMYKSKDDGLTFRQRLSKLGLSMLLSYGFVSNMAVVVCTSCSWFVHSKKTGLSPLAPDQWKPFLAVYAGFYIINNVVRPLRFALSVAISTKFDDFVNFVQRKTKFSKGVSVGLVVFLTNTCGTLAGMALGISLASAAAGVPVFPPKV